MLATNNGSVAETTEKQLNALQRWWHNINWENIINTIVDKAIGVVLLTLLFFILQRLSFFLLDRVYKQYEI